MANLDVIEMSATATATASKAFVVVRNRKISRAVYDSLRQTLLERAQRREARKAARAQSASSLSTRKTASLPSPSIEQGNTTAGGQQLASKVLTELPVHNIAGPSEYPPSAPFHCRGVGNDSPRPAFPNQPPPASTAIRKRSVWDPASRPPKSPSMRAAIGTYNNGPILVPQRFYGDDSPTGRALQMIEEESASESNLSFRSLHSTWLTPEALLRHNENVLLQHNRGSNKGALVYKKDPWVPYQEDQNVSPQESLSASLVPSPSSRATRRKESSPVKLPRDRHGSVSTKLVSKKLAAIHPMLTDTEDSIWTQPLQPQQPAKPLAAINPRKDSKSPGSKAKGKVLDRVVELENALYQQQQQHSPSKRSTASTAEMSIVQEAGLDSPFKMKWTEEGIKAARNALFEPQGMTEAADLATPPRLTPPNSKRRTPHIGSAQGKQSLDLPTRTPESHLSSYNLIYDDDEDAAEAAPPHAMHAKVWRDTNPMFDCEAVRDLYDPADTAVAREACDEGEKRDSLSSLREKLGRQKAGSTIKASPTGSPQKRHVRGQVRVSSDKRPSSGRQSIEDLNDIAKSSQLGDDWSEGEAALSSAMGGLQPTIEPLPADLPAIQVKRQSSAKTSRNKASGKGGWLHKCLCFMPSVTATKE